MNKSNTCKISVLLSYTICDFPCGKHPKGFVGFSLGRNNSKHEIQLYRIFSIIENIQNVLKNIKTETETDFNFSGN